MAVEGRYSDHGGGGGGGGLLIALIQSFFIDVFYMVGEYDVFSYNGHALRPNLTNHLLHTHELKGMFGSLKQTGAKNPSRRFDIFLNMEKLSNTDYSLGFGVCEQEDHIWFTNQFSLQNMGEMKNRLNSAVRVVAENVGQFSATEPFMDTIYLPSIFAFTGI
ncbi:hypothetical protein ACJX0J_016856, partial [Zea mays]